MITAPRRRTSRALLAAGALGVTALLAGCAGGDPLATGTEQPTTDAPAGSIVIGSQDYYSNEIIAEIYAQALEADGVEVQRDFRIGAREVYMPEVEAGDIDLLPEYTGNALQYFDPEATQTDPQEVYDALSGVLPEGIRLLTMAEATDQDSYNVTQEFSEEYGVTSLADLAGIDKSPIILGGNPEINERPYGPDGLLEIYGVEVEVQNIKDSGGPLTIEALKNGTVAANDLVTLEDPENMFLPQNVVPLASENITDEMAATIDEVSAALTTEQLIALNALSVNEQMNADDIAAQWLSDQGLVG